MNEENAIKTETTQPSTTQDKQKTNNFVETSDEVITLGEAVSITGKSKVFILKVIKEKEIQKIGLQKTNKKGRPANVYDRTELLNALLT